MWRNVKRLAASASVVVLFALYSVQRHAVQPGDLAVLLAVESTTTNVSTIAAKTPTSTSVTLAGSGQSRQPVSLTPTRVISSQATSTPASTDVPSGAYQDGTYLGSQANAYWGNVQVRVVVTKGQISDVQFMEYPNHRNRSVRINDYAIPELISEAIQSQISDVDVVSGATDTSEAFIQSLDAALSEAKS